MRPDLQALTPDDLAAIGNRGLLKKATKELDSGDLEADWVESDDGTIEATWSDGMTCLLPGDKTVNDAECTCPATGMCRHIIRTVLAWQKRQSGSDTEEEIETLPTEPWDPGSITDEIISEQVPKNIINRANRLWKEGILAELIRSPKPSARFHSPGHTIRFPVPNDLRYGFCSCPEPAPCPHTVLAVRAFRLLDKDKETGIVHHGSGETTIDPSPLHEGEKALLDLIQDGFGGVSSAWKDRLLRISTDCHSKGHIWPGVILEELADEFVKYHDRDAAFSPGRSLYEIGEYLLRCDAIESGVAPVPLGFIRGTKTDRDISLGSVRFIGLGAMAEETRTSTELTVFLQDSDSGHPVTVSRVTKENPDSDKQIKPYYELSRFPAVRDASIIKLARGQLVSQGGKRKASGKLVISRARTAVNPQNYSWEKLKAPILVEDISEIVARMNMLPPASFRPRSTSGDFHVCPISAIHDARFDPATNSVYAVFEDASGHIFQAEQPWNERNNHGTEHFLSSLSSSDKRPVFISGNVKNTNQGLVFRPAALIIEDESGTREALLPWVDEPSDKDEEQARRKFDSIDLISSSPYENAEELATEILLNGLRRMTKRQPQVFTDTAKMLESLGLHQAGGVISRITAQEPNNVLTLFRILALSKNVVG